MTPLNRLNWVPLAEAMPEHRQRCFISDGVDIGLAVANARDFPGRIWWQGCGFGGWEWEWDLTPTHWAPADDLNLPRIRDILGA